MEGQENKMGILRANLRHFYQRRWLWLWYVVIGGFGFLTLVPAHRSEFSDTGSFVLWLIVSILVGCIAADMVQDIMSKPFVFCLPGHRKAVKKIHLVVAAAVNLPPAFVFLRYPYLDPRETILAVGGAFSAGMICYGICVVIIMGFRFGARLVGVFGVLPVVVIWLGYHIILERIIIAKPLHIVGGAGIFWVLLWFWLDARRHGRDLCSRVHLGLFDSTNFRKQRKYRQEKWARESAAGLDGGAPGARGVLLRGMHSCRPLSRDRYFWGVLYEKLSPFLNTRYLGLSIILGFFLIIVGYFFRFYGIFLYIIPLAIIIELNLPIHSDLLLPAGRSEKFYGTVLLSVLTSIIILLTLWAATLLITWLVPITPTIVFGERQYNLYPVELSYISFPLIFIPVIFTFLVLFPRDRNMAAFGLFVVTVIVLSLFNFIMRGGVRLVMELTAGLWVIYLLVLGHHCYRRCLAGR